MTPVLRILLPCLFAALFVLSGPVAALALLPPARTGAPVIVIAPDAPGIVQQAEGQIIGPLEAPFAVLATFDDPSAAARGGALAWFFRDGTAIAAACAAIEGGFE